MWETQHNNADFQDYFAGDLEDSKSTSGGVPGILESYTFVPISWMCMKQTSVSHSSTEAETISLDAGVRIDGIHAHTLWDLVIETFHSVPNNTDGPKRDLRERPLAGYQVNLHNLIQCKHTNVIPNDSDISSNTIHSGSNAVLCVFEDDSKIQIRCIDPAPNRRHPNQKVTSRVMNGTIFFICSTSAISAPLAALRIPACRNGREKRR